MGETNRDDQSILCGKCIDGYSESINTTKCVKCRREFDFRYLWLPILISFAVTAFIMFTSSDDIEDTCNSPKEYTNKIKRAFSENYFKLMLKTMILKNALYYEQGLAQVSAVFPFEILFTSFASMFNLSTTFAQGFAGDKPMCFINGLNAKQKILVDLLIPALIVIFISCIWIVSKFCIKKPISFKNKRFSFKKAFISTYLLVVGNIFDVLFRLMHCQSVGGDEYHFYFGYEKCYGKTWILAVLILFAIILTFIILIIKLYRMEETERMDPKNPYSTIAKKYKPNYFWWELILLSRRIMIAGFSVSVTNNELKFLFIGMMIVFLQLHDNYKPFAIHEANRLESVLLSFFILVPVAQSAYKLNWVFVNVFLSFCMILPVGIILFYSCSFIKHGASRYMHSTDIQNTDNVSDDGNELEKIMDDDEDTESDETKEIAMAFVKDANRWDYIDRNESISTSNDDKLRRCLSKDKSTAL